MADIHSSGIGQKDTDISLTDLWRQLLCRRSQEPRSKSAADASGNETTEFVRLEDSIKNNGLDMVLAGLDENLCRARFQDATGDVMARCMHWLSDGDRLPNKCAIDYGLRHRADPMPLPERGESNGLKPRHLVK